METKTVKGYQLKYRPLEEGEFESTMNTIIGASEAGMLLEEEGWLNKKLLMMQKLGFRETKPSDKMLMGLMFEEHLATLCCYYQTDTETTYENYRNKKMVRKLIDDKRRYYVEINGVPFRVSPDYYFEENGEIYPVDTKFVQLWSYKQKELTGKIHNYVYQSLLQQLFYGAEKGYIFYAIGNEKLSMTEVVFKDYEHLIPELLEEAKLFYSLLEEYRDRPVEEVLSEVYIDVPYSDVNTHDVPDAGEVKGEPDDERYAMEYLQYHDVESSAKKAKKNIKDYIFNKYPGAKKVVFDTYVIKTKPFSVKVRSVSDMLKDKTDGSDPEDSSYGIGDFFV